MAIEDLFPVAPKPAPEPLTVTQLNQKARLLLERNFMQVMVVGEVSGHKVVQGHHYFSLKDRESQINAALFKREAQGLKFRLQDGMEVVATGRLTIYAQYGRYQIVLDRVEPRGAGSLATAFEALKARLLAAGMFDNARKRPLPHLPRRVAVVTSPTGAVIRDIIHVATRRYPNAQILLVPTRVQGAEAAPEIVRALIRAKHAAAKLGVDVIVVARGGGSLEDLWCFNDERVAQAIFDSPVPVVSAVGHETDFTIADFVADVRAPTPSAAAELIFPQKSELVATLSKGQDRIRRALLGKLKSDRMHLRAVKAELGDGKWIIRDDRQRLSRSLEQSATVLRAKVLRDRRRLKDLELRLAHSHPRVHVRELGRSRAQANERMVLAMRQRVNEARKTLASLTQRLEALSPLGVLERGYAIVLGPEGQAVRQATDVKPGDALDIRVHRGELTAQVTKTK